MPQTLSAKRALRRDRRREAINKIIRQKMKKILTLAQKKPSPQAQTQASSALDQAAKKGIIHKRKAARLKSRLAKLTAKNRPPVVKKRPKRG